MNGLVPNVMGGRIPSPEDHLGLLVRMHVLDVHEHELSCLLGEVAFVVAPCSSAILPVGRLAVDGSAAGWLVTFRVGACFILEVEVDVGEM